MNYLLILNDPPYGTERSYNGLRVALALAKTRKHSLRVFLMADAAFVGKRGQNVPKGFYNIGNMIRGVAKLGADVAACGSCMDARGLSDDEMEEGVRRGSMELLAEWTDEADKVIVF